MVYTVETQTRIHTVTPTGTIIRTPTKNLFLSCLTNQPSDILRLPAIVCNLLNLHCYVYFAQVYTGTILRGSEPLPPARLLS
jgi:hypothetical protein